MNAAEALRRPAAAPGTAGEEAYALIRQLYPLCRSLTGDGLRRSMDVIGHRIPLTRTEIASGTRVFDWEIPPEWNIRDAWIKGADGRRVVDFRACNLHVVGYSQPVRARLSLAELKPHLRALPDYPDWIPYHTSYFRPGWGFCLTQRVLDRMAEGEYEVCIDATLAPGSMTLAECLLRGDCEDEVLVFTHSCHPSLCNDNLSGVAVAAVLAETWARHGPHHYSYRFVFAPATLGSLAWLCLNETRVGLIRHGLVLGSLGDGAALRYRRSRRGKAEIDRIAAHVIGKCGDFAPYGDERQFCSPGFDLPVGRLMRAPDAEYPEYHSSADNLDFVSAASLDGAVRACLDIFGIIEGNSRYINLSPKGEPRLGARGLYQAMAGHPGDSEKALLWLLNQSDGTTDLLTVAQKSGLPFALIETAARALVSAGLLRRLDRC